MTDYEITEAMLVFGGGFVEKLAMCFRAADEINQRRLKHAFPEVWKRYEDLAIARTEHARNQQ